jgi:hypothetical protein
MSQRRIKKPSSPLPPLTRFALQINGRKNTHTINPKLSVLLFKIHDPHPKIKNES